MKSSVPTAAALLSLVAHVAGSVISSSVFAEPVTVPTGAAATEAFPSAQGTATTVTGSFTVPTTFSPGATTVTIPGNCICPSSSFISGPVPSASSSVIFSSGPVASASTVTISIPAGTISVTSFSAAPTATGGGTTVIASTVTPSTVRGTTITASTVTPSTVRGTTIIATTAAPSTVNSGNPVTVTLTASTTTFVATGTPISAVTSYFATGTAVSAVTSYFAAPTTAPAITSYFATPSAAPTTAPVVTVTMISSSAGCTCPQSSDAALKLKDTSAAMSRGGRTEGAFAVAVAGVLAALI